MLYQLQMLGSNLPLQTKREILQEPLQLLQVSLSFTQKLVYFGLIILFYAKCQQARRPDNHVHNIPVFKPRTLQVLYLWQKSELYIRNQ